jgi:hypothetical protein
MQLTQAGSGVMKASAFVGQKFMAPDDPLQPNGLAIAFSLILNFGLPLVAWLLRRKLKRFGWLPYAVVCVWEIISTHIFAGLILPKLPADEAPGPGDGFVLFPTLFSAAVGLLISSIMFLVKFSRWLAAFSIFGP